MRNEDLLMEKLFYQDTHMIDFEAKVTECVQEKEGRFRVLLDRTAFFPEEGGQGPDAGTLGGLKVLDVQIRKGRTAQKDPAGKEDTAPREDLIYHYLEAPLKEGSLVKGHVDWPQRFDYMQQHTGEHILSGLVHAKYGYDNVGFHLGKEEVTLDFNGSLTLKDMREIELEANRIVWRNLPVLVFFPAPEILAGLEYRSKLTLTENVRIVEIPGVDVCACCAPHVEHTGEIGLIKVTNVQSHRGGVRVNILCGERALGDYTLRQDSVGAVSVLLSARQDRIPEAVTRLKEEALREKQRANGLQARLLEFQIAALPSPEASPNAILFTGELDAIALRNAVNALCERYSGYCGIFSGDDSAGYRYIIGSSALDCREAAKLLRERFGAKGGGTAPMVQGSIAAPENEILSFFSTRFSS